MNNGLFSFARRLWQEASKSKKRRAGLVCLAALALLLSLLVVLSPATGYYSFKIVVEKRAVPAQPDFSSIQNVDKKKQAFFDYFLPMIQNANDVILAKRSHVESVAERYRQNGSLHNAESRFIERISLEYKLEAESLTIEETLSALLRRVDIVPSSLALAQAAKESGWGTSRFAREANNFYGQWCYSRGCGLVPNQRSENAVHEVRKFADASAAVESYLMNLNTHSAYYDLRSIRVSLRENGEISGAKLAEGLSSYSERGYVYVEEIRSLIAYNNLEVFDSQLSK